MSDEFNLQTISDVYEYVDDTHKELLTEFDTDELTDEGKQFYYLACDHLVQAKTFIRLASMRRVRVIEKTTTIWCDRCEAYLVFGESELVIVMLRAMQEGWSLTEDKHLCPRCKDDNDKADNNLV